MKKVKKGDSFLMVKLGKYYLTNNNKLKGLELLGDAAKRFNSYALYELGIIFKFISYIFNMKEKSAMFFFYYYYYFKRIYINKTIITILLEYIL